MQIAELSAAPGDSSEADSIVNRIWQNLMKNVKTIKMIDKARVIVWTVSDVTLTPYAY